MVNTEFDVAAAIRPGAELLDDPGGEARRRIRQAEGQRLRPRALDPLIPHLLLDPDRQLVEENLLVGRRIRDHLRIAADREEIEVNAA